MTKVYAEKRLLGYSAEQMFDVVADVERYCQWLPWCKRSDVYGRHGEQQFDCKMEVGFAPFVERYLSRVTCERPHLVKSVCYDGMLFNNLEAVWKFSDGLPNRSHQTCTLDFKVTFEFRKQLHSQAAHLFFDQVVKTQISAFLQRAERLYGAESIRRQRPQIVEYRNM